MQIAPLFQYILNSKRKLTPSPTYHTVAPFPNIQILRLDMRSAGRVPFRKIERLLAAVLRNCALLRVEIRCLDDSNDEWVERVNRRTGVSGKLTFIHSSGIFGVSEPILEGDRSSRLPRLGMVLDSRGWAGPYVEGDVSRE